MDFINWMTKPRTKKEKKVRARTGNSQPECMSMMAPPYSFRNGKPAKSLPPNARSLKRKRHEDDVASLAQQVEDLDVKSTLHAFSDLPLSTPTLSGLSSFHFKTP